MFFQLSSLRHSWGLLIEETERSGMCALVFSKDKRSPRNSLLCLRLRSHSHLRPRNEFSPLHLFSSLQASLAVLWKRGERQRVERNFVSALILGWSQADWFMTSEQGTSWSCRYRDVQMYWTALGSAGAINEGLVPTSKSDTCCQTVSVKMEYKTKKTLNYGATTNVFSWQLHCYSNLLLNSCI